MCQYSLLGIGTCPVEYGNQLERWLLLLEADDHEEIRKELEAIAMRDPVMKRAI